MRNNQPSLTLGPKLTQDSAAANSAAAVPESKSKSQSVQLSGLDSKGRAVPGAFGMALAGAGAPDGGRKPKRVSSQILHFALVSIGHEGRYRMDAHQQQFSNG